MDLSDATKYLLHRIQNLEPELAIKIIGCILIQDRGERDMIRLAYASDKLLENLVHKTKLQLGYLSNPSLSSPISISSPPFSDSSVNYMSFSPNGSHSYWDAHLASEHQSELLTSEFASLGFGDFAADDYRFQNQSLPEFPVKICHYFNKGFCKHGSSCRYHHATDNFSEDHVFSPGSLEKLEIEISELLKLRRGNPVSIASLPMLYYEKYGKTLQAEGYLTESQRHGRAGYSLTKLLARLKGIRLIDRIGEAKSCYSAILRRPHGQHSVILAEDASKYSLDNRSERNDPGPIVNGSRQIYLTFPADSTFTEEDVSNYFSTFGAVEDVRIPCQQKRMFGFVTFVNANTAKTALVKGNPHFVCGSRVLAKPYREKSKLIDRKYMEKNDHMHHGGNYFDMEPDFSSRRCEPPRFLRRQLMEQEQAQAQALEMERRRLSELQLSCKFLYNRQYIDDYSLEDVNSSQEHLQYLLGVFNNKSGVEDRSKHSCTEYSDQDSQGINLPDSPFGAIGSSVSTVF